MKDMKTKVIALMLVIPLMLIFSTSTVIKSTEILVNVPVSSVEISGDKIRYVDLAEKEKLKLDIIVLPENATNKKVTFTTEPVSGQKAANVKIDDNGLIAPLSIGSVTVIANADGGRMDRVQLNITSSKPIFGEIEKTDDEIVINEGTLLKISGKFTKPQSGAVQFKYESSNKDVATVSALGTLKGLRQGTATVTASYEGISINQESGEVTEGTYSLTYPVTVAMTNEYVSFGSGNENMDCFLSGNETELSFDVNLQKLKNSQLSLQLFATSDEAQEGELFLSYDRNLLDISEKSIDLNNGRVDLSVTVKEGKVLPTTGEQIKIMLKKEGELLTVATASVSVGGGIDTPVPYARFDMNEVSGAALLRNSNTPVPYAELDVGNAKQGSYYVVFTSLNESVLTASSVENACYVTSKSVGSTQIKTAVYDAITDAELFSSDFSADDPRYIEPLSVEVLNPFRQLSVEREKSSLATYKDALDSEFAVGYYDFSGGNQISNLVKKEFAKTLVSGIKNNGGRAETSIDGIGWSSDNPEVATIENGIFTLKGGEGKVTITAKNDPAILEKLSVLDDSFESVSASVTVNVRRKGVNVTNDEQLYAVTKDGNYEVILQSSVSLGDELKTVENYDTFDYKKYADTYTFETDCTADNTYYRNIGRIEQSKIRCAVEIKNNLYGNGYSIDADCLTTQYYQKAGSRIFKGPINLVSYSVSASEGNMAVKSQDSVIFMVKNDGVTVTNCELKGCLDSSISSGDSANLSNLDYCGTVLEVVGDNFNLTYSRVNLGRTAVRVYGKPSSSGVITTDNIANYRSRVNISNCILSHAREFILKVGTNRIKRNPSVTGQNYLNTQNWQNIPDSVWENASPFFTGSGGEKLQPGDENLKNDYFYDNYVLTDVTLKDSAFFSAGLFSIGLDGMFGGLVLNGWDYNQNYRFGDWRDVGGTSYPAVLRLKGDVRFYDWKDVESINSDTLLEGHDSSVGQIIGFKLDMGELIKNYDAQEEKGIISYYNGKACANGGIAYFGGGKNYSVVDTSGISDNFNTLTSFSVPIKYISGEKVQFLYYTAGKEPFRFLVYDSNSPLSVEKQIQDINENTAYSWIKK